MDVSINDLLLTSTKIDEHYLATEDPGRILNFKCRECPREFNIDFSGGGLTTGLIDKITFALVIHSHRHLDDFQDDIVNIII